MSPQNADLIQSFSVFKQRNWDTKRANNLPMVPQPDGDGAEAGRQLPRPSATPSQSTSAPHGAGASVQLRTGLEGTPEPGAEHSRVGKWGTNLFNFLKLCKGNLDM